VCGCRASRPCKCSRRRWRRAQPPASCRRAPQCETFLTCPRCVRGPHWHLCSPWLNLAQPTLSVWTVCVLDVCMLCPFGSPCFLSIALPCCVLYGGLGGCPCSFFHLTSVRTPSRGGTSRTAWCLRRWLSWGCPLAGGPGSWRTHCSTSLPTQLRDVWSVSLSCVVVALAMALCAPETCRHCRVWHRACPHDLLGIVVFIFIDSAHARRFWACRFNARCV
jgi:hypothetical protein